MLPNAPLPACTGASPIHGGEITSRTVATHADHNDSLFSPVPDKPPTIANAIKQAINAYSMEVTPA